MMRACIVRGVYTMIIIGVPIVPMLIDGPLYDIYVVCSNVQNQIDNRSLR